MFGAATPDSFRIFFPKDFIDAKVKEEFKDFMTTLELPYADLTDFCNATIISGTLTGLKDDHDVKQTFDKGREKTYKGSKPVEEGISKDIEITMKLVETNMNWYIMRRQLEAYLDWSRPIEKNFLPPIYFQTMDEEDRILMEVVHSYVRFVSISDVTLSVQDNGIISREFLLGFTYNKIEYKYHQNQFYNPNK